MANQKTYKVRFYQGLTKASRHGRVPTSIFDLMLAEMNRQAVGPAPPHLPPGSDRVELRDLVVMGKGQIIRGVLALNRDDAPHVRQTDGVEAKLNLKVGESLIEKNHFIFYKDNSLLVWQVNVKANHVSQMATLLSKMSGGLDAVSFGDLFSEGTLDLLKNGELRTLEVTLNRPLQAQAVSALDFGPSLDDLSQVAPKASFSMRYSAGRRKQSLPSKLKEAARVFAGSENVQALKVKIENVEEPIDLLAETVKDAVTVSVVDYYPDSKEMYAALDKAKDRQQKMLDANFNSPP